MTQGGGSPGTGLLGSSPAMAALRARIAPVARARRTTLISGPTGTGKELVARALHDAGQPAGAPFVVVHCGALPDTLAEDELFGHAHGAFTGARERRRGLIRSAESGTLFLDEINTLNPHVQASLLRFLESGELRSLGSDRVETADTWVLAATNQDLGASVRNGSFRSDLLFRLEVLRIDLPPLRLRGDDIELLAYHFLHEAVGPGRSFTARAIAALHRHDWPGNVRELKHCVERASLLTQSELIDAEDLGLDPGAAFVPPRTQEAKDEDQALEDTLWRLIDRDGLSLAEALEHCERAIIEAALRAEQGHRTRAAERLRIHLRTIFKKLNGRRPPSPRPSRREQPELPLTH
jgi:two-component system NtrC family response regulator